jgi:hypothetical protein
MIKGLNNQEKSALYFHIFERCEDWQTIFKIAIGEDRFNNLTEKAKQTSSSRWKNSASVQMTLRDIKDQIKAREERIKEEFRNEGFNAVETEPREKKRKNSESETDFLNRDEFLQFLNKRANETQDDKTLNDTLKMLSDNMRYKESENDKNNEIQRFYTPMVCKECPIYRRCEGCKVSDCPNVL